MAIDSPAADTRAHNGGMCGRYAAARDAVEVADWFEVEELPASDLTLRYNVTPTSEAYIVVDTDGVRSLQVARWGLVPSWSKDASRASRMINARSETVAEKPAFRSAFRRRRCLVPADGYYEWQSQVERGLKQPFYIHRSDCGQLAFAGLFEDWKGPHGPMRTFCLLTKDAVESLSSIHDRMPVIVQPKDWRQWLDPASTDVPGLLDEVLARSSTGLEAYPVSTQVNKPANDDATLISPVGPVRPVG